MFVSIAIPLPARVFLLVLLVAILVTAPATADASARGDFDGLVDIGGGRKMYLECRGAGSPTVVLVAGLKGSADDWKIAKQSKPTVFGEVARFSPVCAYDRPGTPVGEKPSRSDPVPQPTTAGDAVADLHALLNSAGEVKPYVLVGHSYGGLVVRLYASTYPEDVCGLVLVDALSEELRNAETPEQWVIQRKLMEGDIEESLSLYPALERNDADRSFDQIRAAPRLRPRPLIVLSADRPWGPQIPSMVAEGKLPDSVPANFGYVTDAAQKKAQEKLAHLVPNAKHITNTNSGHEIHKEQPQIVVDAIRDIVEVVRCGSRPAVRRTPRSGGGLDCYSWGKGPNGRSPPIQGIRRHRKGRAWLMNRPLANGSFAPREGLTSNREHNEPAVPGVWVLTERPVGSGGNRRGFIQPEPTSGQEKEPKQTLASVGKKTDKEATPETNALPLTQSRINAIRAAFKAGVKPSTIARQFGVSRSAIQQALSDKADR